jgi:hypothetical protein
MTFSKRVGMEPASDLKKRISSLCEEAGFVVAGSQIFMHREDALKESVRHILTWVHQPHWNPIIPEVFAGTDWENLKDHQIEVRASIGCDGTYDGTVQLICMAADQVGDAFCPTLRDCKIQILDLPQWLGEIARQMREVIAACKRNEKGPWRFGETHWKYWDM